MPGAPIGGNLTDDYVNMFDTNEVHVCTVTKEQILDYFTNSEADDPQVDTIIWVKTTFVTFFGNGFLGMENLVFNFDIATGSPLQLDRTM